jgi:hypothetical protein
MRNHTDTRDLDQALAQIESLDLEPIKFKINHKQDGFGWTNEHTDRIEVAYRRFLTLLAKYPDLQIAPTRDIDAFWHAHILDTRKYAADCERIFGGFVHHYPYLGLRGDQDKADQAANALYALFVTEFGEEAPNNARGAAGTWCAGEPPENNAAAWCAGEPPATKAAAWCAGEPPANKAGAWCAVEPPAVRAAGARPFAELAESVH